MSTQDTATTDLAGVIREIRDVQHKDRTATIEHFREVEKRLKALEGRSGGKPPCAHARRHTYTTYTGDTLVDSGLQCADCGEILRRSEVPDRVDSARVLFWDLKPGDVVRCRNWDPEVPVVSVNYALRAVALRLDRDHPDAVIVWPLESVVERVGHQEARGPR